MQCNAMALEEKFQYIKKAVTDVGNQGLCHNGRSFEPGIIQLIHQYALPQHLLLQRFDPCNDIRRNSTVLIIGRQNSGKTSLIKDIVRKQKKQNIVGIVDCHHAASELLEFISPNSVHVTSNAEAIFEKHASRTTNMTNMTVILDDFPVRQNTALSRNIIFSRHLNLTHYIAVQYSNDIQPDIRDSADYVFIIGRPFQYSKMFYHFFEEEIMSLKEFNDCTQHFCDKHGVLVLDCNFRDHLVFSILSGNQLDNIVGDCLKFYQFNT
jgi:hypothetical protein